VFQPFSAGPRNCLGRRYGNRRLLIAPSLLTKCLPSMAYAEMRLILAYLIFNFDFELVDKSQMWDEQEAYVLYQKPPLMIHVKSRQ
jgi:cytochrome P450